MNKTIKIITLSAMCILLMTATNIVAQEEKSVEEHMAALEDMCAQSAEARTQRHGETPLYERLGGYDKIHTFITEVVRLHRINDDIKHLMEGVDDATLIKHVSDFMAAGTGGTAEYTGRSMPDAHAHLKMTDGHFLAAGSDIVTAMKTMEYGENEINEVVCILVSLKDQVVLK